MPASTLTELTITCPHCQQVNELSAVDLPEDRQVNCSRCGAEVGVVADLKREAPDQAEPAHDALAQ